MLFFLKRKQYHHLNKVLISKSALEYNYRQIQALHPKIKISPVLKSNAYGHGLRTVAPIFDSFSPAFLVVDSLYEAFKLKALKVKTPILILGFTLAENYLVKPLPFHFTVFDIESAKALNKKQKNCPIHIFVDTGMSREGVKLSEFDNFVKEIKKLKNLNIVGLASHFADADNFKSNKFSEKQLVDFKKALKILESNNIFPKWRHISASSGAYKFNDKTINMIRAGMASYGINPLDKKDNRFGRVKLKPVMSFISTLVQIKSLEAGESVGYNCTFTASKKMKIGIVAAGYYDGVDRRLSNKGIVLIRNKECKILGRVSMNITVVDLSKVNGAKVGDEVVLISNDMEQKNNLTDLSKQSKTISYVLMVNLAENLKRVIIE